MVGRPGTITPRPPRASETMPRRNQSQRAGPLAIGAGVVAALNAGVGRIVQRHAAGPLQIERRREVELEALPLPLGGNPVLHVHQGRPPRSDNLVRERLTEDGKGGSTRLPGDRVLVRCVHGRVVDHQRIGGDQPVAIGRTDRVEQILLELGREPVSHADSARLVDRDSSRAASLDVLAQVRLQALFAMPSTSAREPDLFSAEVN